MAQINPFIQVTSSPQEHDPSMPLEASVLPFPDQLGTIVLPEARPSQILRGGILSNLDTPEIRELQEIFIVATGRHVEASRDYELRDAVVAGGSIPTPKEFPRESSKEYPKQLKPIKGLPPQYAMGVTALAAVYAAIGR